jgi:hypothetical protein
MGMFDRVKFEDHSILPLPKEIKRLELPNDFQSKDFDCLMDEYLVLKNGKLAKVFYKDVRRTKKEYEEALKEIEFLKTSDVYSFYAELAKTKRVQDKIKEIPDTHGKFNIYDIIKTKNGKEYSIDYELKFTDGILVDVKLVSFSDITPKKEKKIKNKREIT